MNEKVTLNRKEQKKLKVLNEVNAGHMTGLKAAEMLGLSLRHVRRLLAGYRQVVLNVNVLDLKTYRRGLEYVAET
jgi:hypothetical protein